MSNSEPTRQIRTHTCFSYCTSGIDSAVLGEDRQECVDLKDPADRDQILCVLPTDTCEESSVAGSVYLTNPPDYGYTFSPLSSIYAILAANPVMFIFDLLCIYLQKMKINADSAKASSKLLAY